MSYQKIGVEQEEFGTFKITHGKDETTGLRSVRAEDCYACGHRTLTGYDEDGTPRIVLPLEFDIGVPSGTEITKLEELVKFVDTWE